ncbi:Rad4 transglutaminase-like domain-containing protein, partial [Lophiotrema nucula]
MPPHLPRKRLLSDSPEPEPSKKRARAATRNAPSRRRTKESVFDTLDAPPTVTRTLSQTKKLLELQEEGSELSDAESSEDEFEDVEINGPKGKGKGKAAEASSDGEDEEEQDDWEDALGSHHRDHNDEPAPVISGDLEITMSKNPSVAAFASSKSDGKKGPSKIQRHIRVVTHGMHVQMLMFHNLMRNTWIQDQKVQKILVENLNTGVWREMDKYWRDSGIVNGAERVVKGGWANKKKIEEEKQEGSWKDSPTKGVKVFASPDTRTKAKGKGKEAKEALQSDRNSRDWGATSDRLEPNTPNLSAGDPLLRLMKYLTAYWKSKYKVVTPSLRKRGYLSPASLEAEISLWREDPSHSDAFGERTDNLEAFRDMARKCQGSRDVGHQLFTALLRGLGLEARMVASLQPAGFGWSQGEEGKPKNTDKLREQIDAEKKAAQNATPTKKATSGKSTRESLTNGTRGSPIDLEDEDSSELSSAISISSDSEAEIKPTKKPSKPRKLIQEYPNPTYWTEVISHLTHTPVSVCPFPGPIIASSAKADAYADFYPRGSASAKKGMVPAQAIAYVIAFSSDGTAKDVTTRYLPKHQWPGKTKGFRMPVEKVPIYNKRGKVKKWEEFDWFKSVLRPYARSLAARQPWDEIEDEGDLVPAQPERKKDMDEEGGKETLQGYKNSAEYVLERHLRREEALKQGAKIVRYFTTGKGDKVTKEPVYRRKDIVNCKTVESWHKDGREVKEGAQPLKYVAYRAVTIQRKRELEERERDEGAKPQQALYSRAQTDWIIPPPIENGKIPKNAFGNMDVYVPTMVPKGAIHIPLKGTARICRKLNIEYAEACTGFEFGKQRAVPVLTGVVVATENEDLVIDAWEADQAEKERKESEKREKLVLGLWKKFFVGLRIVNRFKEEYGEAAELPEQEVPAPKHKKAAKKKSEYETFREHEDFEGGFVRDEPRPSGGLAGGFVRDEDEEMADGFLAATQESETGAGPTELTIDHGEKGEREQSNKVAENAYQTPISLHSALKNAADDEDDDELEVEVDEEVEREEAPTSKARGNASRKPRGKTATPRGRGKKRTPTAPTRTTSSDADSAAPSASRAALKRQAARKSQDNIKSHYFAQDSDEETDKPSPVKKSTASRGRGRGRPR